MRKAILLALLVGAMVAAVTAEGGYRERNSRVICQVFGSYCQQALTVARFESGLSEWAQNGQYQGLFQMGSSERARYGHGPSPWTQARAAFRYFVQSGRDWSPWSCRP